jgi:hypothetical protein
MLNLEAKKSHIDRGGREKLSRRRRESKGDDGTMESITFKSFVLYVDDGHIALS